jgi:hypothetical protein
LNQESAKIALSFTRISERTDRIGYASEMGFFPLAIALHQPRVQANELIISDATIILRSDRTVSIGTMVCKDGKIVSVSEGSNGNGTSLKGKYIYPGFLDPFVAKGVKAPPASPDTGKPNQNISAPPSLWIGNRKGIFPEWKAAESLDFTPSSTDYKNGFVLGNLTFNSASMKGISAAVLYSDPKSANRVINPKVSSGMSFRQGSGSGYPSNILGQIALLRQVLSDAQSIKDGSKLYDGETKPYWMNSLDALQPVVKKELPVFFEANIDREIERAFRLQEEYGFRWVIVGARDAYRFGEKILATKTPVVLSLDWLSEPNTESSATDPTPVEFKRQRLETWKKQVAAAKTLADLGVTFSLSAGSSGESFWKNARKTGLTEPQVIDALTINPARLLGVESQFGTIEAGKSATFVVTSGPLLDEATVIEQVWIEGTKVYPK